MIKAKKLSQSKTIWLSLLIAALAPLLAVFPELRTLLGDYYGISLAVLSVSIAVLRVLTTKPVSIN